MATTASRSFSESLADAVLEERLRMWRAAETVRAHVGPGAERDELLLCLGISEAVAPEA